MTPALLIALAGLVLGCCIGYMLGLNAQSTVILRALGEMHDAVMRIDKRTQAMEDAAEGLL